MRLNNFFKAKNKYSKTLLLGILILGIIILYINTHLFPDWNYLSRVGSKKIAHVGRILAGIYRPSFILPVIVVFTIEFLYPVKKNQKIFSVNMFQDFFWYVVQPIFLVFIAFPWLKLLDNLYEQNLSFLTIKALENLPQVALFMILVFAEDFLAWFHHLVRHKVPLFWNFHEIHHSQSKMNIFTEYRVHYFDFLIAITIKFLPMKMLGASGTTIFYYIWIAKWYPMIYHANIKSDYGFLKYFLVTPQSHRIHHSTKEEHYDKNFGVLFSIWDRLFGTHYEAKKEYPDTGIPDEKFPLEKSVKGINILKNFWKQLIYPLKVG